MIPSCDAYLQRNESARLLRIVDGAATQNWVLSPLKRDDKKAETERVKK